MADIIDLGIVKKRLRIAAEGQEGRMGIVYELSRHEDIFSRDYLDQLLDHILGIIGQVEEAELSGGPVKIADQGEFHGTQEQYKMLADSAMRFINDFKTYQDKLTEKEKIRAAVNHFVKQRLLMICFELEAEEREIYKIAEKGGK